jgi:hypothetical protein
MSNKLLSATQVSDLVKAVGPSRTVIVEGEFGIGKTSIHHAFAKDPAFAGYHMPKPIDCMQLSDGSVVLPDLDRSRGVSRELPNERFGLSDENHAGVPDSRPSVICLDEIAKTRQFIKDMLAPLVLERRLGNKVYPKSSIVFGCTNISEEGLGDHMEAHLRNRIIVVKMRKPTKDEWVRGFAVPNGVHESIIAAVEMYPMVFDSFMDYLKGGKYGDKRIAEHNAYISNPADAGQGQVVTPRSLHAASDIVVKRGAVDDYTMQAALEGCLGVPFAANIMSMIRFGDGLPSYDRVVADPGGTSLPANPTAQIVQVQQFIRLVEDKDAAEAVSVYVGRMKGEMKSLFVNTVANSSKLADFARSTTFGVLLTENRKFLGQ